MPVPDGPELPDLSAAVPFAGEIGVQLLSATPEEVRGRLEWAPERCTSGGVMHGGALMTLADSVAATCAFLNLPEGALTTTIECKANFFRAVRDGAVEAVSRPLHVGRSTIVVQTDVADDQGRRVALVIQSQAVIRPGER